VTFVVFANSESRAILPASITSHCDDHSIGGLKTRKFADSMMSNSEVSCSISEILNLEISSFNIALNLAVVVNWAWRIFREHRLVEKPVPQYHFTLNAQSYPFCVCVSSTHSAQWTPGRKPLDSF
jgi:hypothetical protein